MSDPAPIEAPQLYLRQRAGELAELCIGYGNQELAAIYVLRPNQLKNLAIDATKMALNK